VKHFNTKNGLPSNIINDIFIDDDLSILLATNIGLFLSSKFEKWLQVSSEQIKSVLLSDKKIYYCSKDGLVINESYHVDEFKKMYLNLSYVLVNNHKDVLFKNRILNYDQNNLEFNFDVISYSTRLPEIIYQLSGSSNFIGNSKNQQVTLQNLSPGTYTLNVSLAPGSFQYLPLKIIFEIKPAIWQTKWFIILSIMLILIILIIITWLIFRYLKIRK